MFKSFNEQLIDCNNWLTAKDSALEAVEKAKTELAIAEEAAAEYTEENIAAALELKVDLEKVLGINQPEPQCEVIPEISTDAASENPIIDQPII